MVGERIRLLDDWQKLCDIDIILSRHSISRESENDIFTLVVTSRFPFTYLAFPRSLSGERAHFPSKVTKAQVFRSVCPILKKRAGLTGILRSEESHMNKSAPGVRQHRICEGC